MLRFFVTVAPQNDRVDSYIILSEESQKLAIRLFFALRGRFGLASPTFVFLKCEYQSKILQNLPVLGEFFLYIIVIDFSEKRYIINLSKRRLRYGKT